PAFPDVERRAADEVPAVLRLGVGTRVQTRADLELRGVDVAPQTGGALDVHGALPGIECVRRAVVVDARVVEVAAVEAGLPPVEDRLALRVVVDDLRR